MKGTLDIHRALLAHDVPHEVIRLPRLMLAGDELPEALDLPAESCAVVRMYEADGALVAVITRARDLPDPARLLNLLGARSLRLAAADTVNAKTDYAAGLVAPVLLPPEVTVLCDSRVTEASVVYTPTGESGTALGIPSDHLVDVAGATRAELCVGGEPVVALDELDFALAREPIPQVPRGD